LWSAGNPPCQPRLLCQPLYHTKIESLPHILLSLPRNTDRPFTPMPCIAQYNTMSTTMWLALLASSRLLARFKYRCRYPCADSPRSNIFESHKNDLLRTGIRGTPYDDETPVSFRHVGPESETWASACFVAMVLEEQSICIGDHHGWNDTFS
jgi:hypothetical protein